MASREATRVHPMGQGCVRDAAGEIVDAYGKAKAQWRRDLQNTPPTPALHASYNNLLHFIDTHPNQDFFAEWEPRGVTRGILRGMAAAMTHWPTRADPMNADLIVGAWTEESVGGILRRIFDGDETGNDRWYRQSMVAFTEPPKPQSQKVNCGYFIVDKQSKVGQGGLEKPCRGCTKHSPVRLMMNMKDNGMPNWENKCITNNHYVSISMMNYYDGMGCEDYMAQLLLNYDRSDVQETLNFNSIYLLGTMRIIINWPTLTATHQGQTAADRLPNTDLGEIRMCMKELSTKFVKSVLAFDKIIRNGNLMVPGLQQIGQTYEVTLERDALQARVAALEAEATILRQQLQAAQNGNGDAAQVQRLTQERNEAQQLQQQAEGEADRATTARNTLRQQIRDLGSNPSA